VPSARDGRHNGLLTQHLVGQRVARDHLVRRVVPPYAEFWPVPVGGSLQAARIDSSERPLWRGTGPPARAPWTAENEAMKDSPVSWPAGHIGAA
jgi:hypothetical protein